VPTNFTVDDVEPDDEELVPPLEVLLVEPPLEDDDEALAFDAPDAVALADVVNVKTLEPPPFVS
jgi:hypothetical protein